MTFGTKYILTSLTQGTKTVPKVENFGAKFVPKELMQFGTIIVPNVYKCFICFFQKVRTNTILEPRCLVVENISKIIRSFV